MVAYDYSKEPNNPWDKATWSPSAQIDFMRRTRAAHKYDGSGEPRITQRIMQSDTKGIPPKPENKRPPYQVIIQKRFLGAQSSGPATITVGFGQIGAVSATERWMLAIASTTTAFPSTVVSEAACGTAPTADTFLQLLNASGTLLCTITFAAGQKVGVLTWAMTRYVVNPGDILYVLAAPTQDATFADVNIAFVGTPVV